MRGVVCVSSCGGAVVWCVYLLFWCRVLSPRVASVLSCCHVLVGGVFFLCWRFGADLRRVVVRCVLSCCVALRWPASGRLPPCLPRCFFCCCAVPRVLRYSVPRPALCVVLCLCWAWDLGPCCPARCCAASCGAVFVVPCCRLLLCGVLSSSVLCLVVLWCSGLFVSVWCSAVVCLAVWFCCVALCGCARVKCAALLGAASCRGDSRWSLLSASFWPVAACLVSWGGAFWCAVLGSRAVLPCCTACDVLFAHPRAPFCGALCPVLCCAVLACLSDFFLCGGLLPLLR